MTEAGSKKNDTKMQRSSQAAQLSPPLPSPEIDLLKNERLKIWLSFWRFVLGTVAVGVITSIVNWQIQVYQLKLERQQREQEYIAQFLAQAMDENLEKRLRFAHYFASLTLSTDMNQLWNKYYRDLGVEALNQRDRKNILEQQLQELLNKRNRTPAEQSQIALLQVQIKQIESDIPATTPLSAIAFSSSWDASLLDQKITNGVDFTWRQATHDGTRIPQTQEHIQNIIDQAIELQKVRAQLNKPIQIISWYRPEPWNSRVGGARNSTHLSGIGVDISIEGLTAQQIAEQLPWWEGGMGTYSGRPNILHLDIGVKRRWGIGGSASPVEPE